MPFTLRRSSGVVKGPCVFLCTIIRRAITGPMPDNACSSLDEAVFGLIHRVVVIEGSSEGRDGCLKRLQA